MEYHLAILTKEQQLDIFNLCTDLHLLETTHSVSKKQKNPKNMDAYATFKEISLTQGIIHLYRERLNESTEAYHDHQNLMAILAVPCYLSPNDLLAFISSFQQHLFHIRILRDSIPNRFMVVLKMKNPEMCHLFYKVYSIYLYTTGIQWN
jgi:hypothetical protein